ncbi:hypothetical protein [Streptomyces sp. NPDC127084]|uniref:hypothetical protein n=1 Tax=Streptomyces sp. NPDC127084 TaxID=3347133 RepID=UPI003653D0A4
MRARFADPASVRTSLEPRPAPHGPVWLTADGGALVARVAVSKTAVEVEPGRYIEFSSTGWKGTTGIPWAAFTQIQLNLTILKIPLTSSEVSIAARASWPLNSDGTRHTGN